MSAGDGNGTGGDEPPPTERPPVEHARLGVGLLWGVPFSLALWAIILYLTWLALR